MLKVAVKHLQSLFYNDYLTQKYYKYQMKYYFQGLHEEFNKKGVNLYTLTILS